LPNFDTANSSLWDLNTNYYWRVQNRESNEYTSGWLFVMEDTTKPTVTLSWPTSWTVVTWSSRTFSWDWYDNYSVSGYTLYITGAKNYTLAWIVGESKSITGLVTGNYSWWVVVEDSAWNTWIDSRGPYPFTVDIDTIAPTAHVEYDPVLNDWATGSVTATLTWESEPITITNNWWSNIYVFTNNGNFTFEFEDAAENTWSVLAEETWLDNSPPTFIFGNSSGNECEAWSLSIVGATDNAGVWLHATPYSFDWNTWSGITNIVIAAQQPWSVIRTWWVLWLMQYLMFYRYLN